MKIPIIFWLYYLDLYEEFLPFLKQEEVYPIFGLCNDNDNSQIIKSIENHFSEYEIQFFENIGADIFPFIQQLNSIKEPYFIKIHTKRDSKCGSFLYNNVLNNIKACTETLNQKEVVHPWGKKSKNDIGMIASKNCIVSNHEYNNSNQITELCNILDIEYSKVKLTRYVSGTMFMSRTDIFKKYFNPEIILKISYLIERGKVEDKNSGSYTHALERIFGYIITNERMRIKSI